MRGAELERGELGQQREVGLRRAAAAAGARVGRVAEDLQSAFGERPPAFGLPCRRVQEVRVVDPDVWRARAVLLEDLVFEEGFGFLWVAVSMAGL